MSQKAIQKTGKKIILPIAVFLILGMSIVLVSAATSSQSLFEEILEPLTTIYNFVKYAATVIAGLIMLFAGITYITSGSDPGKREKAKSMIMYVIIGLIVIWAAPFVVELVLG